MTQASGREKDVFDPASRRVSREQGFVLVEAPQIVVCQLPRAPQGDIERTG